MKRILAALLLVASMLLAPAMIAAQTYYYDGGSISMSDLRRARPYKKGTYLIQSGRNRGVIFFPKHDARGNDYLELMMEHFLQGSQEIKDYSPIQIQTIVGGSHGIASVLALLMDLEAREMLGVNRDQGEKINELFVEFRKQVHARMQEFQRTNPRATTLQTVLARTAEIERLSLLLEPRLKLFLSDPQVERAKEMVFQLYGGLDTAVVDLGILSLFNLDREQREKLELVAEDANEKRDRVFSSRESGRLAAADMQAFDAALGDVAVVISRKIREIMTKEQLEKSDALMTRAEDVKTRLGLTKD